MNTLLRGLYSGLMAGVIVAILYFVDYGPGNGLYGVARWFAFDDKSSGRLIGFIVLGVLVYQLSNAERRSQEIVETCATYWHTVDFLWVLIFALLYVVR